MKSIKNVLIAAFAVLVGAAYVTPAATVSAVSSASLSIVPKKNYTIEQGKTIKDKLVIRNLDSKESLDLTLRVVDFTFTDDGGTPKLMLAEDAPQTTWSLRPFLTVPKSVKIPPKTSKNLDMSVAVPAGHGAGSYYSAIVYSSGASEGGNVGLSASGVTLVFASIPGKVNEDLKLEKFGAYRVAKGDKKADYTYITMDEPQNVAYTLKNKGNVTEAPVGNITLKSMFGKEYTIDNINPNSSLALIGQTRTFVSCIQLKSEEVEFGGQRTQSKTCASAGLLPGYYSTTANLFYGQNGNNTQEITGAGSFWYLPWWFIIILVILVGIIVYVIWRIKNAVNGATSGRRSKKRPSRRR